jgi:hypothetical protein
MALYLGIVIVGARIDAGVMCGMNLLEKYKGIGRSPIRPHANSQVEVTL